MIEKKPVTPATRNNPAGTGTNISHNSGKDIFNTFFTKENYTWMLAGLVIIALGMLVMSGGKSSDPNVFDQKEVYSTTRITIAPLLIVIGLGLEVVGIFKKPKA